MENEPITVTPEQYQRMLKALEREEKQKIYSKKVAVKNQILVEKAKAAGIKVTEQEIKERMSVN